VEVGSEMAVRKFGNCSLDRNRASSVEIVTSATSVRRTETIRVFVVADIRLFREGLALVLKRCSRLLTVGTGSGRDETLRSIGAASPDVVLLDMATPESYQIVRDVRRVLPRVHVVALGVPEGEGSLLACAEAGVAGCVSRDGSPEDLVAAIETAARGDVVCPPQLVGPLWRRLAALAGNQRLSTPAADLTRRELEIVQLIEFRLSNKEIARRLGIEVATVKNHVHNLLDKLRVATREQAAACARTVLSPLPSESRDLTSRLE
jgi:DNA-binding NarL/FixJ family response regulator